MTEACNAVSREDETYMGEVEIRDALLALSQACAEASLDEMRQIIAKALRILAYDRNTEL